MKDADGNYFVDNAEGIWGHLACYHGSLILCGGKESMERIHAEYHEEPCDHPIEMLAYNAEKADEYLSEELGDDGNTDPSPLIQPDQEPEPTYRRDGEEGLKAKP